MSCSPGSPNALKPTFDSGRIDMAARITGSNLPWTAVAGIAIDDTSGLQSTFEKAAEPGEGRSLFHESRTRRREGR